MSEFLRWLFGLKQAPDWISGGSFQIQFHSLPQGAVAVGYLLLVILGLVGIGYLYRSEQSTVRPLMRTLLAALRALALLCVVFMMLELVLVIVKREPTPSHLLVLVDTSASMQLNDPYERTETFDELANKLQYQSPTAVRKKSRLELARRALQQVAPSLGDHREVTYYGFSQQLNLLSPEELAKAEANGHGTAVGDALAAALAANRGVPLAGVLLVSDGQSNAGEDPKPVAERAGKQGVSIVSLAVGTLQGPSNARLAAIEADPVVFLRDPTEVSVMVEGHGVAGRTGNVVLERRGDGVWSEVGREEVIFSEETGSRRITFKITPEAVGEIELRARIADFGEELTEADNFATHQMKVVRQEIRVLLIAGSPSPEVQFLRNALVRDTGLEFACWLQTAGDRYEQMGTKPIRRLPANRQELEQFDVVILFDPDMRALGPAWSEMLTQFIGTSGGGVIYVAGELHTRSLFEGQMAVDADRGRAIDNTWLRVLPVTLDAGLFRSGAEVSLAATEPWNLELTAEGTSDPIFQFDSDPLKNREILASLPGMFWHFPVTRPKPGASVLARHGDPRMRNAFGRHALLATHRYGPGRTAFLAFDATYRWRYLHEEYFDGFWARLIDRVGRSKALGGRYPFQLTTDQAVYRTGDRVMIRATATEVGEAGAVADLRGEVELAGQSSTPLDLETLADQVGVAQASFTATEAGVYSVRMLPGNVAAVGDTTVRPATIEFRVETAQNELDRPKMDLAMLEELARASGGSVVRIEDFEKLPDAFKIKEVGRLLEYRDELWDAPALYGSLMLLLTMEWILRKRARMA